MKILALLFFVAVTVVNINSQTIAEAPAPISSKPLSLSTEKTSLFRDKKVLALAALHGSLTMADVTKTELLWKVLQGTDRYFVERDPLMRPFVGHPAAFYGVNAAIVFGTALLAHKLKESNNKTLKKLWWIPQVVGTTSAITGIASTGGPLN